MVKNQNAQNENKITLKLVINAIFDRDDFVKAMESADENCC